MADYKFYAFFIASKIGKTGLTVTVDVYGPGGVEASAQAATEIGGGLYSYTHTDATPGDYMAVFKTADATVDCQHIPDLVTKELPLIDAAISSVDEAVWAATTRTLTQTAAQVAAVLAGSDITVQRGDTLSVALTGLGNIAARTKLYFTVKVNPSRDPDTAAILKIEETAGLTVVNGVAYTTVANGDITVDDEADGDVTITVDEAVTALLMVASGLYYDIQMVSAAGVVTLTAGRMTVAADVTRAVS